MLLWVHGRRLGLTGDGPNSGNSLLVLDGQAVGSTRAGPANIPLVATSGSGAGSVVLTGAVVGDSVQRVVDLTRGTDVSADFESTITVAGHIQQTTTTSGHPILSSCNRRRDPRAPAHNLEGNAMANDTRWTTPPTATTTMARSARPRRAPRSAAPTMSRPRSTRRAALTGAGTKIAGDVMPSGGGHAYLPKN